jgi:hypothetical protein
MARLVASVAALPSARFAGFTYRAKESGELARHVLILGADYGKTLAQSLDQLAAMRGLEGVQLLAAQELAASLEKSLNCHLAGVTNPDYTKADTYEAICPGVKVHKLDGSLEVAGLSHSKTVLETGTFKTVNSSAKTIAKNELHQMLPIGKYRTFCLDAGALESVRIEGKEIDFS